MLQPRGHSCRTILGKQHRLVLAAGFESVCMKGGTHLLFQPTNASFVKSVAHLEHFDGLKGKASPLSS